MRQIHPVSFHEKFVASGVYTHYFDGKPQHVESWSIHELPDGAELIRVDLDVNEYNVLIEGWRSPKTDNSVIERLDIHYLSTLKNDMQHGKSSFILEKDRVQLGFTLDNSPRQQKEVNLPTSYIVSTVSKLFFGFMIANLASASGNCVPVCMCNVVFRAYPTVFDVEVWEASALSKETDTITIAGKTFNARRFQWGDPCGSIPPDRELELYQRPTFWLDEYEILLQADYSYNALTQLIQYARRPELPRNS